MTPAGKLGLVVAGVAALTVAGLAIRAANERKRAELAAAELPAVPVVSGRPAMIRLSGWPLEIRRRASPLAGLMVAMTRVTLAALIAVIRVPVLVDLWRVSLPAVSEIPESAREVRPDLWSVSCRSIRRVRGPDRLAFCGSFPGVAALM